MTAAADLLDAIDELLERFVAFPTEHDRYAVAGWVLHTWTLDAFDSTPRLALLSPEKGSGKTRALEVIELVVPSPKHTVNMSAAVLFRLVGGDEPVTLLMDEADTYLGWKVAAQHEDIRGLVNAGHRRGATTYRMNMEAGAKIQEFPAYAAVALAGIGDLPDTIIDRSIVIGMKRRTPDEVVEQFRRRIIGPQVATLAESLEVWGEHATDDLTEIIDDIELPEGIEDRPADVWEPIVAVGDLAGEPWSERLRTAAVVLNGQREARDPSLGVQLLRDIRSVFERLDVDRITSAQLADELVAMEGAPWAELRGEPIDPGGVAKRLRKYEVRPGSHWFGDSSARGYLRQDFYDAFRRYLPPSVPRDARDGRDGSPTILTGITDITSPTGEVPLPPGRVDCPGCGEVSVRPGEVCIPCEESAA